MQSECFRVKGSLWLQGLLILSASRLLCPFKKSVYWVCPLFSHLHFYNQHITSLLSSFAALTGLLRICTSVVLLRKTLPHLCKYASAACKGVKCSVSKIILLFCNEPDNDFFNVKIGKSNISKN